HWRRRSDLRSRTRHGAGHRGQGRRESRSPRARGLHAPRSSWRERQSHGHPAVPEQYEAIEAMIQERKYDVVAISGDVSQRSRAGEFQRAREFIRKAEKVSHTIVVPGNHDVAWWL